MSYSTIFIHFSTLNIDEFHLIWKMFMQNYCTSKEMGSVRTEDAKYDTVDHVINHIGSFYFISIFKGVLRYHKKQIYSQSRKKFSVL